MKPDARTTLYIQDEEGRLSLIDVELYGIIQYSLCTFYVRCLTEIKNNKLGSCTLKAAREYVNNHLQEILNDQKGLYPENLEIKVEMDYPSITKISEPRLN